MDGNSNIPKGELISILSDIDSKINNLHSRSNSDFMQLSEYLKDYHKKTRIISENAFRIFETITGGKDMDLIKELKSIQTRVDSYRRNINDDYTRKQKTLKEIGLKTNQLNIILRNLRQDFTTLRFLSTNYSLISSYNDPSAELDTDPEKLNSEVNTIHQSLISFNEQVEAFREAVSSVISEVNIRTEKSFELFRDLSTETDMNIDTINLKNHESKIQFPVLKEKTVDTSKSISDIITHLQYQDIIRQKIEHIQSSHYGIIDDLNHAGKASSGNCSHEDYIKIGDIIDLQAAQLLLVSKEYQNALNVITRNFQGIAKDMSIVSGISDRFSFEGSSSETTLLRQIRDQLDQGIIQIDQNNEIIISRDYLRISAMLTEIIRKAQEHINPQLEGFYGENNIVTKFRFNEAGSGVFTQMIALNRDIELKSLDIKENINALKNQVEGLNSKDEDIEESGYEIDRLHLMVRITKILDSLDRDNEELDKVLIENRELNTNILRKIELTVNKSDYCEYFENTVGGIISQLTGINNRIRQSCNGRRPETKAENLEEIKTAYTMESERIIHDMVVTGKEDKTDSPADNEIEFF